MGRGDALENLSNKARASLACIDYALGVRPPPGTESARGRSSGDAPRRPSRWRALGLRGLGWVCASLVPFAVSCKGAVIAQAESARPEARVPRASGAYVTPATLFASTDPDAVSVSRLEPDGRRLLVSHGMRLVLHRDGSLEKGEELLPVKDAVQIVALPDRLGGGYLFYVTSSSATMIWQAHDFTGELEPLANFDFPADKIIPGFDRLYLLKAHSSRPVALDVDTGKALGLGPLPPSPSYETLAFADAWMGVVDVPLRGVLASFDAGASWHPVPEAHRVVASDHGPLLKTDAGWGLLTPEGVLRRWESPDDEARMLDQLLEALGDSKEVSVDESDEASRRRAPPKPLGRDPLRLAVLHGVVAEKGSAYVANLGTLARVRLRDGKLLETSETSFPANASCHGVRLGKGYGFVCSEERGRTTIYALERPLALRVAYSFDQPRYVSDNEYGSLVVRGRCAASQPGEDGYYCLITGQGEREIRVRGDVGAERVALFKDGSAAVIVPPRKGASATLTRVAVTGSSKQVKLKLPKTGPLASLVREGIWLDGFQANDRGELLGWVAGSGPFVGIRIHRDGSVEGGEVHNDIDRVLLSGRFALLKTQYGKALQSVDGGFHWLEVPALEPITGDDARAQVAAGEQGCSPIGCATASWLRVGWSRPGKEVEAVEVEPPERTRIPSPGGGRWAMHCYASGRLSPRALPAETADDARERAQRVLRRIATASSATPVLESSAWQPFFEATAPRLPARDLGFDLEVEYGSEQLHAYAWGQRGSDWGRTGNFLVRVLDRFEVTHGVWATDTTRSPWGDEMSAAAAFGEGSAGGTANWQLELEPSGREGLLMIREPSQTRMFIVSEGRAITPIRGAESLTQTSGVVRLGSTWHVGAVTADGFSIFKIVGDRLVLLGTHPFDEERSAPRLAPRLVRNTGGDALAVLLEAQGWYLYPVNQEDGSLESPLVSPPSEVAVFPPSCSGSEDGYTFVDRVSVAPYVELMGEAAAVNASRVEARFVVAADGVCVDALAARASAVLPESLGRVGTRQPARPERAPVLMVLSEQGMASRRWEFDCYP